MREKGELLKKVAAFCFIFLVIGFISAVFLQAQNPEKETKKKTDIKSESAKKTSGKQQDEKKAAEDIKPPDGEQWIAPGDEKLYKFNVHPITPKEGITGGVLIYYGHYIRPPYNVEIKPIYENGYEVGVQVIINGLVVSPDPDFIDKRFFKKEKKEEIVLNEYEKKCYENYDKTSDKIIKDLENIVNEVGLKPENIKTIENKFKEYLSNSPLISYFKLQSIFSADITLNICNEDPRFNTPETIFFSWAYSKPQKSRSQFQKERWEKELSMKSLVIHVNIGDIHSYSISELDKVSMILINNKNTISILKSLYSITNNLKATKSFYYNFEYMEYLHDRRMGLIK